MLNANGAVSRHTQCAFILLAAWGCSKNTDSGAASGGAAGSSGGALATAGANVGGSSQLGGGGSGGGQGGAVSSSGGKANSGTACGDLQLERNVTVAATATDR